MNRCRSAMRAPAWSIKTGSSDAAKALMGKTVAMIGGAMYAQYRAIRASGLPGAAGRDHAGGRRLLLRQSADGARHDRDHAARGPQGAGAYRGGVQSRADAQQDLPQGRHRPGQHRPQRAAGRDPAQDRREAYRRFHRADLHGRSDRCPGRDRRDHRVRRHRRRQARRPDSHLHGDRRQQDREGLQPLRIERAQAGLYLWQPRPASDRAEPGVRHGLGRRRLAAVSVPDEDRTRPMASGCVSASSPNSRPPLPAITPRWCRCRRRCSWQTSPSTPSAQPARST